MSNYPHLLGRITNTPLLVSADYLSSALAAFSQRMDSTLILPNMAPAAYTSRRPEGSRQVHEGVAVVSIDGSLSHKSGNMDGMSTEMRSYVAIQSDFDAAMADPKVKGIVLDIDSPGGEAAGCFSLCRHIYKSRGQKPILAIVDEFAASAAYAIASSADRIIGPEEMYVGSIGVVTAHVSQQKMLEDKGLKVTFIYAGDHKVDGNPAEDLPVDVQKDIQSKINKTYNTFVSVVAKTRTLQKSDVIATEAQIYSGSDALKQGLVDEVLSADEAFAAFCEHCNGESQLTSRKGKKMSEKTDAAQSDKETVSMEDLQSKLTLSEANLINANAEIDKLKGESADAETASKAKLADAAEQGVKAERDRVVGIVKLESANQSANHQEMALEYCDMGMSVEQADALLKKQTVAEEKEPENLLSKAIEKTSAESEEVDTLPDEADSELSAHIASATAFKADTSDFINYQEGA